MAIPYVKQTWTDGSGGGTPISAARLGVVEQGVFDAHYQPSVRVFHNAAQSITNATLTALAFNSETIDQASNAVDTMHDTVTNNSRLTCRYAGVYLLTATVEWAANATGYRHVSIRINGTTGITRQEVMNTNATQAISCSQIYPMAVNDYAELMVFQTSGGALNVNSTSRYSPDFSMVRVA